MILYRQESFGNERRERGVYAFCTWRVRSFTRVVYEFHTALRRDC